MKIKIIVLIFIIVGYSFQNLFGSDSIPAGNVSGHWLQANSPYKIYGNITVTSGSLLQIDSGVVVEFQGHYQFLVNGRILALGTTSNQITFTAINNWWGIRFDGISNDQDSSVFINCKFEKGNANGIGKFSNGGAFYISYFSKIRIANSLIANNSAQMNGGGIYCDHAAPIITGNTISNNNADSYYGGGIYCTYSSPQIINNLITHNLGNICCKNSSPTILGNTISYCDMNVSIYCEYSSPSIINNVISHNPMGIYIAHSSPLVTGNVIINNSADYGAGIRCVFSSSPHINNNTISNNTAFKYGGGLWCGSSCSPIVKNNILWGNTAADGGSQIALDQTCFPKFYNCDVQGGSAMIYYFDAPVTFSGTYENNINIDPLFINPSTANYSLQSTSQCIDAGTIDTIGLKLPSTDIAGEQRICNSHVDIGAYENCTVTGIENFPTNIIIVTIYPNPAKDRITIEILGEDLNMNMKLLITNFLGENVKQFFVNSTKMTFQLDGFTSGMYFYQLESEGEILNTGKIILK